MSNTTDTTISDIIARYGSDRDSCDAALSIAIGITGPGAVMPIERDGRVTIWASERARENDSDNDDNTRAVYRSAGPVDAYVIARLGRMAWIDRVSDQAPHSAS